MMGKVGHGPDTQLLASGGHRETGAVLTRHHMAPTQQGPGDLRVSPLNVSLSGQRRNGPGSAKGQACTRAPFIT